MTRARKGVKRVAVGPAQITREVPRTSAPPMATRMPAAPPIAVGAGQRKSAQVSASLRVGADQCGAATRARPSSAAAAITAGRACSIRSGR